jgi:hypothetical protein
MSAQINRRAFLQALAGLGASFYLPDQAPAAVVDAVWQQATADPWYFAVDEWGTIRVPDYLQDEVWEDVFAISPGWMKTPQDVIDAVDSCVPLARHFQDLASAEAQVLERKLEAKSRGASLSRPHARKIVDAINNDPDFGWQAWIELEGAAGVSRFRDEVADWLQQPVDYTQSEFFPVNHGSQGQAKAFFEILDFDTLDALGVVIVEGEHPGSTYYAAELRHGVEEANASAGRLDLPFRFHTERRRLRARAVVIAS